MATNTWLELMRNLWRIPLLFLVFYMGLFMAALLGGFLWFVSLGHINLFEQLIDGVAWAYDRLDG